MSQRLIKGILEKNLKIKKGPNVVGQVCIHFPNQAVQDIVLRDYSEVEIFKRINITADDVRASNINLLLSRGDIVVV